MSCNRERVIEWFEGALAADEAQAVEAHVLGCESCMRELAWLEAEAKLFAQRRQQAAPISPELWRGVEARLGQVEAAPARRRRWTMAVPIALAAAAALLILVRPMPPAPSTVAQKPGARMPRVEKHAVRPTDSEDALTRAEDEDRAAIASLEGEYLSRHHPHPMCDKLAQIRGRFDEERKRMSGDLDGRLALLDGYEEYLHSLQAMLEEP